MRKIIFPIYLAFVMLLLVGTSCDKQPKFELYENRVIACCGVSNPTKNLEWLTTVIKDFSAYAVFSVKLYQANTDDTFNIVIEDQIFTRVYNCDGEMLFGGDYHGVKNVSQDKSNVQSVSPVPCSECEEFYNTHHFVGLIYEKKIVE